MWGLLRRNRTEVVLIDCLIDCLIDWLIVHTSREKIPSWNLRYQVCCREMLQLHWLTDWLTEWLTRASGVTFDVRKYDSCTQRLIYWLGKRNTEMFKWNDQWGLLWENMAVTSTVIDWETEWLIRWFIIHWLRKEPCFPWNLNSWMLINWLVYSLTDWTTWALRSSMDSKAAVDWL